MKARPDYEPLFAILDRLHPDTEMRYWLGESLETQEDNSDITADPGQVSTGVKTFPQVSHNVLTSVEEYVK